MTDKSLGEERFERKDRRRSKRDRDLQPSAQRPAIHKAKSIVLDARTYKVQSVNLRDLRLNALPKMVADLTTVKRFDLSRNDFATIPLDVLRLSGLTCLLLPRNRVEVVDSGIEHLTDLVSLDLGNNRIKSLPDEIGALIALETMLLEGNRLMTLPATSGRLRSLVTLNLDSNRIESLPLSVTKLRKLKTLSLRNNGLTELPRDIGDLRSLETLDLENNKLSSIPPGIGQLSSLTTLLLSSNELESLPVEICELKNLRKITLNGNALPDSLMVAASHGVDSLRSFLRSLSTDDSQILYEAKLMFVGEGNVGKTSLLAALQGARFVENRPTTHGIELDSFSVPHPNGTNNISLNAWDFGGQEVYRVTHQFFFSRRSLYLVVWWPREGAKIDQVEYWVECIKNRVGDGARVIVVATHCATDDRFARIDADYLSSRFGEIIVGFHEVDSKSGDGIAELKSAIADAAAQLPQMGSPFSMKWQIARERIESLAAAQMTFSEFTTHCEDWGLDRQAIRTLAELMHDLGDIIYYGDDEGLKDLVVLQPEWLTKAIGFVLEDPPTNRAYGVLEHSRLTEIWENPSKAPEERYGNELHPYFLRLMEKFDVSYRLTESPKELACSLVSQLVPDRKPTSLSDAMALSKREKELTLICQMEGEATGLIPWLIVRTHRFSRGLHWQRGAFLEYSGHGTALLELYGRELQITARGLYPAYFTSLLSDTVTHLLDTRWPGLKYNLAVPCTHTDDVKRRCAGRLRLDVLYKRLARDRPYTDCPICGEDLDINELLTGFETQRSALENQFNVILKGLIRASTERLRLHEEAMDDRARHMTQFQELSRITLRALNSETKDCPRFFTLIPENLTKWNPANWAKTAFRLTLWCEHPGCEHPTCPIGSNGSGEYVVKQPHEWLMTIAPYAKLVTILLSAAVPVAGSASKLVVDSSLHSEIEPIIALMEKVTSAGLSAAAELGKLGRKGTTDTELDQPTGIRNTAEGAGLRQLFTLLLQVDSTRTWGGLRRVLTPSGDYLWLCAQHYEEYDPGLPKL